MATGNLAPLIPALFTGPNGERLTADQIKRRQEIASSLLAQATDTSPNAGGWASILAKGVQGFASGMGDRRAEAATRQNAEASRTNINALLSGVTGGAQPQSATVGAMQPSADAAAAAAVSPASIPQTADAQTIRAGLVARGLPEHIADGFVVNFQDESGLNPGINEAAPIVPGSRGGYGLYQLTGPRRVAYEQFAQSRGIDPSNVDAQLDFLGGELGLPGLGLEEQPWFGSERNAAESILRAGDTGTAAQAIVNHFLRPSQQHRDRRSAAYANLGGGGSAPVEVAQAAPVTMTDAQPALNPIILETLSSPYASDQERAVAQSLLGNHMSQQQAAQDRALKEQQRAQELARRQQLAGQVGINPAYAQDEALWKGGIDQMFSDAPTAVVNGVVVNTRTGQPVYQAPAETYRQVFGPEAAAMGLDPSKAYNVGPNGEVKPVESGGTSINVDTGTIPAGMRAVRDAQGRVVQYEPIPGSQAANDANTLATTKEKQAGQRETASRVVTDAATRAIDAVKAPGLPATGVAGAAMSWLPESNAAEVRRQVDVLKANATVSNLTAMREASPTGGALGSVTEKEGAMLAAKSGTLDPNSPNFERDIKDYTRTMLEIIHGPQAGKEIFDSMSWGGADPSAVPTDIPGVTIRRKAQ